MAVFVDEQGYLAEEEADGLDSAHRHLLCVNQADKDPVRPKPSVKRFPADLVLGGNVEIPVELQGRSWNYKSRAIR